MKEAEITKCLNNQSLKILTTSDEKNERQDVQNFNDIKKNIDNKKIEKEKREEKHPTVVNDKKNPFVEIAKKEGIELGIIESDETGTTSRENMINLLYFISGAYPYKRVEDPETTINTWTTILGHHKPSDLYKAIKHHITTSAFFPTPAEIENSLTRAALIHQEAEKDPVKAEQSKEMDDYLDSIIE